MSHRVAPPALVIGSLLLAGATHAEQSETPPDNRLYYLGAQGSSASAFYPPQLGHEALIEGTLGEGPRVCGGRPPVPLRVSVMPELTPACNTILPAEPGLTPGRRQSRRRRNSRTAHVSSSSPTTSTATT